MSRHFNYELDENRIKVLLQKTSMSFSEDVWNEFLTKTKPIEKISRLPNFKLNFAINKSVLLTGVFVILIGSFTLLIAKFVDFSDTKSNTEAVREVKPDATNYKIAAALPKKEQTKPTATVAETTMTLQTVPVSNTVVPTNQYASNQTNTYSPAANSQTFASSSESNNMARNAPDTAVTSTTKKDSALSQVPNNNQPRNRKRRKKEVETLETKPMTQELPTTANQEPELELK